MEHTSILRMLYSLQRPTCVTAGGRGGAQNRIPLILVANVILASHRELMDVATPIFCPCGAGTLFISLTCRPDSSPDLQAQGDEFIQTAPDGLSRQLTHLLFLSCQPQVSELIGMSAVLTPGD